MKDNVKDNITSKFKAQLWDDQEMEGKTKKRYYKEVINPTPDNHNYLWVLSIAKKKRHLGSQNNSGSSRPEKLPKIVNCATIKEN